MRIPAAAQRAAIAILVSAAVGIVVACGGAGGAPASGGKNLSGSAPDLVLKVSMKDNFFDPKELTVPAGKVISFELPNDGQAVHNMHILSAASEGRDFLSNLVIEPGKAGKVQARFTRKGLVKFQCDFHLPDMVGLISVE